MGIATRLTGALSLAAVLGCSGLGNCWRYFVPRGHDCCAQDATMKPATNPCGSAATYVTVVRVDPPLTATVVFFAAPVLRSVGPSIGSVLCPAAAVGPPPLVLRV